MFNKLFGDITYTDTKNLVTSGISEGNNLEFKREIWGTGDEEVREMLRDISSMANAYGGYFIVGMDEDKETGKAKEILNIPNADNERDRLLASLMANLQPRIIGLDIKTLSGEDDKKILLIKVPDSLTLHQITFKGLYQFWKRHDRQKNRMTYEEIKDTILKNNLGSTQTEDLIKNRRKIHYHTGKCFLMLTAQPIKPETELFKISNQKIRDFLMYSEGGRREGWHLNFNVNRAYPTLQGLAISDTQRTINLFRNGYMEGLVEIIQEGYVFNSKEISMEGQTQTIKIFRSPALIEFTYSFIKKFQAVMSEIGYEAPMGFSLNLFNIHRFALKQGQEGIYDFSEPVIWKDLEPKIEIGPLVFEFLDAEVVAKELCDRLWQAFGFEEVPYFHNGKFDFNK